MPPKEPQDHRPKLTRRPSNKTERNRKAGLAEGIRITVNGRDYVVRGGDLTALDAKDLRRELGLSFVGLTTALRTDPDIDLIAGIVWLARRIDGERGLPYEAVAADFGYGDDFDIERVGADDDTEVTEGEVVDPEG